MVGFTARMTTMMMCMCLGMMCMFRHAVKFQELSERAGAVRSLNSVH